MAYLGQFFIKHPISLENHIPYLYLNYNKSVAEKGRVTFRVFYVVRTTMKNITLHQAQARHVPEMVDYSLTKESWIEYALDDHGLSSDMLKMLEDLPSEAFYTRESGEIHLMIIET